MKTSAFSLLGRVVPEKLVRTDTCVCLRMSRHLGVRGHTVVTVCIGLFIPSGIVNVNCTHTYVHAVCLYSTYVHAQWCIYMMCNTLVHIFVRTYIHMYIWIACECMYIVYNIIVSMYSAFVHTYVCK